MQLLLRPAASNPKRLNSQLAKRFAAPIDSAFNYPVEPPLNIIALAYSSG